MSKIVWKPGALLAPVPPVLVSCGTMEQPNVLTIAWTGILSTHPAMTYISVRPQRHSYPIISTSGEFAINLTTTALVKAADYCGVKSGKDTNKFLDMSLTPQQASQVTAPLIAESPLSIECKVKDIIKLGSHDMFLSEIVAVNVESALIDHSGRLDLRKAGLVAYAHGQYFELGKSLGTFGYSVRKKKPGGKKAARVAHTEKGKPVKRTKKDNAKNG